MSYKVLDRDGTIMGTYGTKKGAERKKDELDNDYGGYKFRVEKAKKKSKNSKMKIA